MIGTRRYLNLFSKIKFDQAGSNAEMIVCNQSKKWKAAAFRYVDLTSNKEYLVPVKKMYAMNRRQYSVLYTGKQVLVVNSAISLRHCMHVGGCICIQSA